MRKLVATDGENNQSDLKSERVKLPKRQWISTKTFPCISKFEVSLLINFSIAGEELEVKKGNNENSEGENTQRSFIFEAITTFSMYFLVIAAFSKVLTCTHVFRQISQVMGKKKTKKKTGIPVLPCSTPPWVSYEKKLPYPPSLFRMQSL